MTPIPLTAKIFPGGKVRHGFFTRRGGVSKGIYESLNCGPGSSDDPDAIAENRRRVAVALAGAVVPVCTLYQVHSSYAVRLEEPWPAGKPPRADAVVTTAPGIVLGVNTADCAPILLADEKAGVVGAAHAGWRGALSGIVEAAAAEMVEAGASLSRIKAAIGPCIAQVSYEVGPELFDAYCAKNSAFAAFFKAGRNDRHHFDLAGFVAARLRAVGIQSVEALAADTCADEDRFFSFRRATRRKESDYGRQISAIFLAR
ncbi:MAG TPA: peptidoglycan editing factor PgeF [Sphingomonadales bacterium]|nr:peptidoglycan editing factor PgeF [Sphingomonadales bacterium]